MVADTELTGGSGGGQLNAGKLQNNHQPIAEIFGASDNRFKRSVLGEENIFGA